MWARTNLVGTSYGFTARCTGRPRIYEAIQGGVGRPFDLRNSGLNILLW